MTRTSLHTPGPVNVPPQVVEAMGRPMPHHRTETFQKIVEGANAKLQRVFQTNEPVMTLATSGTGAMEASVCNLLSPGDKAVVVSSGKFGERWGQLTKTYGIETEIIEVPWGEAVDPELVATTLDRVRPKAVYLTYSETSTGVLHPIEELARIAKERNVLSVVDAITGLIAHPLPMDDWGVDVVVCGSQKAIMLPPGLSFIALSKRAQEACAEAKSPRYYLDLRKALKKWEAADFPYTPAVTLIMGLDRSLDLILDEGLDATLARFARMSDRCRAGLGELGLEPYTNSPARSLTVACVPEGVNAKFILDFVERNHHIRLAGGQDSLKGKVLRFGHMGYLKEDDVEAALAAVGDALEASRKQVMS